MGGKLTVMIRQKNGEKHSFKAFTGRLERHFAGQRVLDENQFMEVVRNAGYLKDLPIDYAAHDDYENNAAFFAPYYYGLLFFDFKNQQVFSFNGYSGLLTFTSKFVASDLYKPVKIFSDSVDDFISWIEDFDAPMYGHLLGLYDSVKSGSRILYRGQAISEGNKSFLEVLALVLGVTESSSKEDCWSAIKQRTEELCEVNTYSLDGFDDIEAHPIGWTVHNGDDSINYIADAFEYCKKEQLLSKDDFEAWENYLAELQEKLNKAKQTCENKIPSI